MKKLLAVIFMLIAIPTVAHATQVSEYISLLYTPSVTQTTDENGFIHPGITMVKSDLDRMQTHVRQEDEPWKTAFLDFASNSKCSLDPRIHYGDGSDEHDYINVAYNDYFIGSLARIDADTCVAQTIMWYITGVDQYRTNALYILRSWSQMETLPTMNDEQLYFGTAMYKFSVAAEILRYSNYTGTKVGESRANVWSDEDTEAFTGFLELTYDKYNRWWHFMNQHGINNMAFMASSIFRSDSEDFAYAVERTTVNSLYDSPRNGSIISAIREVSENALTGKKLAEPVIELVEMGRDQGHAYGDIGALSVCALTAQRQGALVDPETGEVTGDDDGVSVFDFADHRLLYGANYISAYNLGNPVTYVPVDCDQTSEWTVYGEINDTNRGLLYPNIGIIYNYYKYERGWDMSGDDIKYVTQAYEAMLPEGSSSDFLGFSTLLFSGDEAEGLEYPTVASISTDTTNRKHLENQTRSILEGDVTISSDEDAAYLHFEGNGEIAYATSDFYPEYGTLILRVRTTAHTRIEVRNTRLSEEPFAVFEIPDTGGEWVNAAELMGSRDSWERMTFFTIYTSGTVDIDYMEFSSVAELNSATVSYEEKTFCYDDTVYMYGSGAYLIAISASNSYTVESTMRITEMGNVLYVYPSETLWQNISIAVENGDYVKYVDIKIFVFNEIDSLIDVVTKNHRSGGTYTNGSMSRYKEAEENLRTVAQASCLNKSFAAAAAALAEADSQNFLANIPDESSSDPILHYNFSVSSRNMVTDVSPYGNDGISVDTIFGAGEAVLEDGAYIYIPDGILENADEATITVTFESYNENLYAWLWSIANSSEDGYIFFNPSTVAGKAYTAITPASYPDETGASADGIAANTKTTAATVIGNGEIRLYIDGKIAARTSCSMTPSDLGRTVMNYIGKSPFESDPPFEGTVSDFRIYNRSLTPTEILSIANSQSEEAAVSLEYYDVDSGGVSLVLSSAGQADIYAALFDADGELLDVSVNELETYLEGRGAYAKVFAWEKDTINPICVLYIPLY